jgi:hypothetical protein
MDSTTRRRAVTALTAIALLALPAAAAATTGDYEHGPLPAKDYDMNAATGDYSPPEPPAQVVTVAEPTGFDWSDAAIGAGAGMALALCAVGLAAVAGRRRIAAILTALGAVASVAVGVAVATPPSGLTSQLLARGAAGEFGIHEKSMRLRLDARRATDVALVRATLDPGGSTGWHGHPGPSIVIVTSGTVTMYEPDHGEGRHHDDDGHRKHRHGCDVESFGPGQAFVHPASVHNFVNSGQDTAEFYVGYFVPAGATPLLHDESAPRGCG